VNLSQAGQDYAARVRDAFDRLIATSAATRAKKTRRVVELRAQSSIALLWVLPRIAAFTQQHSNIEVQLHALPFDRNPSKDGADIAIYPRRADIVGYTQHNLPRANYRVYAAPKLTVSHDLISPSDILSRPLLHTASLESEHRSPSIHDWFVAAGVNPPTLLPGTQFNMEHLTVAACIAGAGYALLSDQLARDAVRCGALIAQPGPTIIDPNSYALMMKSTPDDEVRAIAEWLLKGERVT
jgi:LysR family transcriptional regulator, glycine cleavage system transcriptional activator